MNAPAKLVETASEPVKRAASPQEAPAKKAAPAPKRGKRRMLMISVPLLLAIGGGYVWLTGGRYVTTDNAYVHQPMVSVSSDVAGRIVSVEVAENQHVAAGTPLFHLDPEPYRIAMDEADAALAAARLSVTQLRSAVATAQAKLVAAEHIKNVRDREYERQQALENRGISSSAALDETTRAVYTAENDVNLAREGVAAAVAALGGDESIETDDFPAVRAALAKREAAERNLHKAEVVASVSGIVSQVGSLNVGQYVTPGASVASIVENQDTWIEANYKETELETIRIGQPVEVEIDAYPGEKLHGAVESIGSATGSQFALIPAQNATGNWVKVVQRLTVRVSVDPDEAHPLRNGMSATVSVDTGASRLDKLR